MADHPVVVLTGARQVGKSTLLRQEEPFRAWRYHTLDDLDVLAQVESRPESLWAEAGRIVLDEVQKAPGVLSAVKRAVDRDKSLRFVLSGSANLLLMRQVGESLAGWGRDARVPQATVNRYLNLLEATHLFERLPAYTASRTTRLLKAPRVFWTDPGLAAHLAGLYDEATLAASPLVGPLFETLVGHHFRTLCSLLVPRARLYGWRTRDGQEVDFVVEHGQRLLAVEVKLSSEAQYRAAAGLEAFLEDHPRAAGGLLLYCGREVVRLGERVVAVPWWLVAGGEGGATDV